MPERGLWSRISSVDGGTSAIVSGKYLEQIFEAMWLRQVDLASVTLGQGQ